MHDEVVLVTGGGRGIGAAIARHMGGMGAAVAVLDVDGDAADGVAQDLSAGGAKAMAVACNVADSAQVRRAVNEVRQTLGPVRVLVNCAGVGGPFHRITEVSDEEWDWIMGVNLKGVFLLCREALPDMRDAGYGRIVNIASIQGFLGAATSSTYVASKHAVVGYTRAIAAEWGPFGITCNAICPGYVQTRMGAQDTLVPEHEERILWRTPVGRMASPVEIAAMVAHLVGPMSGYINGAAVTMDGGISADVGI